MTWDSAALDQLFAAASAPAHADELAGLAGALTAFSTLPTPTRRTRVISTISKLLAAKALAAAAGSLAVGGVALAAATGTLPAPVQDVAHNTVGAPAAHGHGHGNGNGPKTPKPSESATPEASTKATPSPNLDGLCQAYTSGVADAKGKALDNPAFTVLITTAGGKDKVAAYCATRLAASPHGRPTSLPTQANDHRPSPFPGHSHPTGAPATHPTGPPTTPGR